MKMIQRSFNSSLSLSLSLFLRVFKKLEGVERLREGAWIWPGLQQCLSQTIKATLPGATVAVGTHLHERLFRERTWVNTGESPQMGILQCL